MNGIELSQELQNIDPDLLFRFITAASKEYIENLQINNPNLEKNIIYKPFWLNEIGLRSIHFCIIMINNNNNIF